MKRVGAVLTASLIGLVVLSGCGAGVDSTGTSDKGCDGGNIDYNTCEVTVNYHGRPLNCLLFEQGHGANVLDCDFVEYHEDYTGGMN